MIKLHQKGSVALIILALVVIAGIGIGGYLTYQSRTSDNKSNSTDKSNETYTKTSPEKKATSGSDTEVKNYISSVLAGIYEYQSNNNGSLPADLVAVRGNLKFEFESYQDWKNATAITEGEPAPSTVYYGAGYVCDDTTNLMKQAQTRDVAVVTVLPVSKTTFCLN